MIRSRIGYTIIGGDFTDEEVEFLRAMDRYKRINRQPFPSFTEVLAVLRSLGYRKVAEPYEPPGLKGLGRPKKEMNGQEQ